MLLIHKHGSKAFMARRVSLPEDNGNEHHRHAGHKNGPALSAEFASNVPGKNNLHTIGQGRQKADRVEGIAQQIGGWHV